jgi:hypothetical protein
MNEKSLSLVSLQRLYLVAIAAVTAGFFGFLAYVYLSYASLVTGDIKSDVPPELLANFNVRRFELSVQRFEKRQALPEEDPSSRNPYGVPPQR